MKIFYFGRWEHSGHELHLPGKRYCYEEDRRLIPFSYNILDGGLLPPCQPQDEGKATLVHINGWTVLSFWDRTADKRPNSNSAFVLEGIYDFDATLQIAKEQFPELFKRFTFQISLRSGGKQ